MQPVRTLIADDHPALREGVAALLDAEPNIEIAGTAGDGEEAVQKALTLEVQVVVMDVQMPTLDGIQAAHPCLPPSAPPCPLSKPLPAHLTDIFISGTLVQRAVSSRRFCS